jgi:hypothetical protein
MPVRLRAASRGDIKITIIKKGAHTAYATLNAHLFGLDGPVESADVTLAPHPLRERLPVVRVASAEPAALQLQHRGCL